MLRILRKQRSNFCISSPEACCSIDPSVYIEVHDTEEKGSYVNLVSFLLNDGYLDRYDAGVANRALVTCLTKDVTRSSRRLACAPSSQTNPRAGPLTITSSF